MLVEQYGTTTKYDANPRLVRYIKIKKMQRLKGKGVFIIQKLKPIEFYSKLEHSKNVTRSTSSLYKDEKSRFLKIALIG